MNKYTEILNNIEPAQDDEAFANAVLRRANSAKAKRQGAFIRGFAPVMVALTVLVGGSVAAYLKLSEENVPLSDEGIRREDAFKQMDEDGEVTYLVYIIDLPLFYPINGNYPITEHTQSHGGYYGHRGIDIDAPRGTEILAAADGEVIFADWNNGYGLCVIIDHGERTNVDGQRMSTLYAHCDEIFVQVGDTVTQGQVIAAVGDSGQAKTTQLHFEMNRDDGSYFEPTFQNLPLFEEDLKTLATNDLSQVDYLEFPAKSLNKDILFKCGNRRLMEIWLPADTDYNITVTLYDAETDEELAAYNLAAVGVGADPNYQFANSGRYTHEGGFQLWDRTCYLVVSGEYDDDFTVRVSASRAPDEPPTGVAGFTQVSVEQPNVTEISSEYVMGIPNFPEGMNENNLFFTNGDEIWIWVPTGNGYDLMIELVEKQSGIVADSFGASSTATAPKGQHVAGLLETEPGKIYWIRVSGQYDKVMTAKIADRPPIDAENSGRRTNPASISWDGVYRNDDDNIKLSINSFDGRTFEFLFTIIDTGYKYNGVADVKRANSSQAETAAFDFNFDGENVITVTGLDDIAGVYVRTDT